MNSTFRLTLFSGIRLGTDEMLRASYTPSPAARRSTAGTPTPRSIKSTPTPKSSRRRGHKATPKSAKVTPASKVGGEDITDNLLNLSSSKVTGAPPRRSDPGRVERPAPEAMPSLNTDNLLQIGEKTRPRAQDFFMKPKD